ncbi:MAG: hypothetical protein AAGA48_34430 [Myxococcota bacterium]
MNRLPFFLVLGLGACDRPPPEGIFVGNPGKSVVQTAPTAKFTFEFARLEAADVTWIDCVGGREVVVEGEAIDALGRATLTAPGGEWCGVELAFPQGFTGFASTPAPIEFGLQLQPEGPAELWGAAPFEVDGESYIIELGEPEWLDLGIEFGEFTFDPTTPEGQTLAESIRTTSSLFLDEDDSGTLEPAERAGGPVASAGFPPLDATGDPKPPLTSEGCAQGPTPRLSWGWLFGALGGLILGRRRR